MISSQAVARPWNVQKRPDTTGPNENKPAGQDTFQPSSRLATDPPCHMTYLSEYLEYEKLTDEDIREHLAGLRSHYEG
ncbi:hypothetical protein SAMN05660733_05825 [Lentzea albidocapillata]|uniref:Uncharacterized protein n=1 Tax=Lentzea albidocapillata TaxID=40571 RepID=A0A1W2FEI1_9PSEU|nr:hypothetical protein SAMN05660733_05825 [Lentzea albidocapillata]